MSLEKPTISLFIPAYNEEAILEKNVLKAYDEVSKVTKDFELVIVNDGSTDSSKEIADGLAKKFPKIRHVYFKNGPSRRENLSIALPKARGNVIAYIDADLATDMKDFPTLFNKVLDGSYDIALGSKYMPGAQIKRKLSRKIISIIINNGLRLYFGSRVKDHCCGFKAFKADVLKNLIKEMGYDPLHRRGMLWDAELLFRAQKKGYSIYEFPVKWTEGKKSALGIFKDWKMILYILKLRWRI